MGQGVVAFAGAVAVPIPSFLQERRLGYGLTAKGSFLLSLDFLFHFLDYPVFEAGFVHRFHLLPWDGLLHLGMD